MLSKISSQSFFIDHADMIDQLSLVTLNTVILAGEIFSSIPHEIPACCRTFLAYTGIISIDFQLQEMWKSCRDFEYALQVYDYNSIVYTAGKVALKAMDIFLTIGSFTISCASIFFPASTMAYYSYVTPIATASWFLLIGYEILDTMQTGALLKQFNAIQEKSTQKEIADYLGKLVRKEPLSPQKNESQKIARLLLRQFDIYRLANLKKEVTFEDLHEHLKKRLTVTRAELGLQILGYLSLGVNRMAPHSLIQASTVWGMSLLYSGKLAYNKYSNTLK